jgi:hypothetical protein
MFHSIVGSGLACYRAQTPPRSSAGISPVLLVPSSLLAV